MQQKLTLPSVIGLIGKAGSGKSATSSFLQRTYLYARAPFAAPLKDMLRVLGLNEQQLNGTLKEVPTNLLCGKSPRQAMQLLGSEWGRNLIGPNFWVERWMDNIRGYPRIVADDCRFLNEAQAIWDQGGVIVRVVRPDAKTTAESAHVSETASGQIIPDYEIENTGSISDLHHKVQALLEYHNDRVARKKAVPAGDADRLAG
jgi:hypothetical protein